MWRALSIVTLVAGCDGSRLCPLSDGDCDYPRDAQPYRPPPDGNVGLRPERPNGENGCLWSQKAAWVVLKDEPTRIGHVACVSNETRQWLEVCGFGPAGYDTGHDNCAAQLACSNGICLYVCRFDAAPGAPGACTTGTCTFDPLLFHNEGGDRNWGVCRYER